MYLSHKIALDPNDKQRTYFAKASGTARFVYNWGLAEWQRQYAACKLDATVPKPSHFSLDKQLNEIKKKQFPWLMDVTKCAPQIALANLGSAFKNFFKKTGKYPQFKKRGVHDSFGLQSDSFRIKGSKLWVPKLGFVKMHEPLRFEGKLIKATISRTADRWFVSATVEVPDTLLPSAENQGALGVDLGITTLATLSTGEKVVGPRAHKALLDRVRRQSRQVSRKVKGSKNSEKAKRMLAKTHARIANIRKDVLHKLTTRLTQEYTTVCIEDLNVSGMAKNRRLARSIMDSSFGEFRRQLEYKSLRRGGKIVVADRWYPSSKTCSTCGFKMKDLPLSVRDWSCSSCHTKHDRDVNAAINLRNIAVGSTVTACGEESSGSSRKTRVKLASMKQEPTGETSGLA